MCTYNLLFFFLFFFIEEFRLGVHKGMELNDHEEMEMNEIKWNVFKQGK